MKLKFEKLSLDNDTDKVEIELNGVVYIITEHEKGGMNIIKKYDMNKTDMPSSYHDVKAVKQISNVIIVK